MLITLFATNIVANKYLVFLRFLTIVLCLLFFSFFISEISDGLREKNATSDPEISPEHITKIIQDNMRIKFEGSSKIFVI